MVKDVGWKGFLLDNSRYADIINGIGCNGEQVITEDDLQEADTQSEAAYRDCIRKVAFGVNFAIVGIENQETIDYSLPARSMEYDANAYKKQVKCIQKENSKNPKSLSKEEYLYRFRKDDKLHPVVTFVLYADSKPWDGATSLHELLDFENIPVALKEKVSNYKMNLINIREMTDTSMFQTDVKQVFDFIRCADDKDALLELVNNDPYYQNMEEDACQVALQYAKADHITKTKEYNKKDEGGINVCKAITDLIEDGRLEGEARGKAEGIQLTKQIFKFYIAGKSVEEIAKVCDVATEKVAEILA